MHKYVGRYAFGSIRNPQEFQSVFYVVPTTEGGASPQIQSTRTVTPWWIYIAL